MYYLVVIISKFNDYDVDKKCISFCFYVAPLMIFRTH